MSSLGHQREAQAQIQAGPLNRLRGTLPAFPYCAFSHVEWGESYVRGGHFPETSIRKHYTLKTYI